MGLRFGSSRGIVEVRRGEIPAGVAQNAGLRRRDGRKPSRKTGRDPAAGTHSALLRVSGRGEHAVEIQLPAAIPQTLQVLLRTTGACDARGQWSEPDPAFPDAIHRRRGYRYGQPEFRGDDPHRAGGPDARTIRQQPDPAVAVAAHDHTHQHLLHFGFSVQAHAASDRLFRCEEERRHPATHRRLRSRAVVPHGNTAEHGRRHSDLHRLYVRHGRLQRDDPAGVPRRQHPLRAVGASVYEIPPQAGLHAFSGVVGEPKHHDPAYRRDAGHQAQLMRASETLGVGTHPGTSVQDQHQEPYFGPDAGGRGIVHLADEEHRRVVSGRERRYQGRHDARYDDGHAVYPRAVERPAFAVHFVHAGHAGRQDFAGASG